MQKFREINNNPFLTICFLGVCIFASWCFISYWTTLSSSLSTCTSISSTIQPSMPIPDRFKPNAHFSGVIFDISYGGRSFHISFDPWIETFQPVFVKCHAILGLFLDFHYFNSSDLPISLVLAIISFSWTNFMVDFDCHSYAEYVIIG